MTGQQEFEPMSEVGKRLAYRMTCECGCGGKVLMLTRRGVEEFERLMRRLGHEPMKVTREAV